MNCVSIFIMIIVLVIIYGLLFRLKNNQIIKTIESFENEIKNNLDGVDKINQGNASQFFNGNWTSHQSNVIGSNITNTIRIITENNQDGKLNYKGRSYKFDINSFAIITTEDTKNGIRFKINPNPDFTQYRLGYDLPMNVPVAEIIPIGSANLDEPKSLIFKYAGSEISETVKTIIKSNNNTFKGTEPNIDGNLYSVPAFKSVSGYEFKNDALKPHYEDMDDVIKMLGVTKDYYINTWKPYIEAAYNNTISFQIIREFNYANEQKQFTPFSKLYEFKIFNGDQILTKIIHKPLQQELAQNKLLGKIYNITSYFYMHTVNKFTCNYKFGEPDLQFSKYDLSPKNGMERYMENSLSAPNINSAERNVDSKFNAVYIGNINTYNPNNIKQSVKISSMVDCIKKLSTNTQYDRQQMNNLLL